MKKKKKKGNLTRNIVRITLILFLGLLVSFILCKNEAKANGKILDQTINDSFAYQSLMLIHYLEPNSPNDYTDISALETSSETDSFVSNTAIKTGTSQYYIRVNYTANCVTIFTKDDKGFYTKPYKAMICSSGKSTPKSGTYKISYKYRWLSLYGGVYGQYSTRIVKNILFHSVPYYEQRANSLEYEEYDKLGTTASAGCIRLTVQDAKWIYDNITSGTYVEFYSDPTNPGPLGKPTAEKISTNTKNRNWDPTDPDKNNPWNGGNGIPSVTYTPPTQKTTSTKNTTQKNDTKAEVTTTITNSNKTSTEVHYNTNTANTTNTQKTSTSTTTKNEPKSEKTESKNDKESESTKTSNEATNPEKTEITPTSSVDSETSKSIPESSPKTEETNNTNSNSDSKELTNPTSESNTTTEKSEQ